MCANCSVYDCVIEIVDLPQVGLLLDTGKMGKSEREAREKKQRARSARESDLSELQEIESQGPSFGAKL